MSLETQILTLARQNLSPDEISESLGVELPIVRAVLTQHGVDEITDDDLAAIMKRLTAIAKTNNDLHLAAKVGMWIVEQKRGRAPTRGEQTGPNITILQQIINQSYERFSELIGNTRGTSGNFGNGDSNNPQELRGEEAGSDSADNRAAATEAQQNSSETANLG